MLGRIFRDWKTVTARVLRVLRAVSRGVALVVEFRRGGSVLPSVEASNEAWNVDAYDCRKCLNGTPGDEAELGQQPIFCAEVIVDDGVDARC